MFETAFTVAAIEMALAMWITVIHVRKPLTGGPLRLYHVAMVLVVLSLLCIFSAVAIEVPDSRGLFVVLLIVGATVAVVRALGGGSAQRGPLHAETEAAPAQRYTSRYTVRTAPQVGGQPAYSGVRAAADVRSARVLRIMAMEE